MSRLGAIARRGFLLGSAAVAGGVAFGYYEYVTPPGNPLAPGEGEVTLNPYLLIGPDGVSIVTPRAEMGQGVHTTLAALVAEELDVAWEEVRAIHGPASAAYWNGTAAGISLPMAEYPESRLREIAMGAVGVFSKLLGLQITGGSSSTVDAFERMRRAGAAARVVLVEAASARLGLSVGALRTEAGHVVAPDGTRLAYAELAGEAALIEPPADPPLRPPPAWRYLGRSMPRLDMHAKATGEAIFGIDVRLPGMRHAAVRMNPRLGGPMLGLDAETARGMPGVERVVELEGGVAAIAANTWRAMRAVEAIEIDWGPAPYPEDTGAIFAEIARAFDRAPDATLRDEGDADRALSEAGERRIVAEYRAPFLAHATMEPMNATALFEGDRLTLWAGNQAPMLVREKAAERAGLSPEDVTVHTPFMGGGFGRRAETDVTDQAVDLALAMPGVPVKLTWTREEDTRHDFYRPGVIARMEGVADAEGPVAFKAAIAGPSVYRQQFARVLGFAPPVPDKILLEGACDQPYAIPNYRVSGHVSDLAVPVGSWRSVGNSHNAFFHECFMDELAHGAGLDPVEMRLALIRPESPASARVLEAAAGMAGWGAAPAEGRGRGVAFTHSFGTPVAQIVEVAETDRGIRVEKVWCALDVGTALDPRNVEAQVISGIIYGLSAAIMGEITFADGRVVEGNFNDYDAIRMFQSPEIEVRILEEKDGLSGVGEPGTPPSMPALANAVFDLTGQRIRTLPLGRSVRFA